MAVLFQFLHFRSSYQRCSIKKGLLKISQNSQENNCVGVPFSSLKPATLFKTHFGMVALL